MAEILPVGETIWTNFQDLNLRFVPRHRVYGKGRQRPHAGAWFALLVS